MTPDHPVAGGHVWVASGLSIAILVIATWGVFGLDAKILGKLVLGADNRASTSKFQATAWTYALLFALVTLLVGHLLYADFDAGWDAFLNDGLNTDYLWLLGIPSAGLVGAKAITQSKAQANPAAKPTKPAADPAAEAEPAEGEGADPAATRSVSTAFSRARASWQATTTTTIRSPRSETCSTSSSTRSPSPTSSAPSWDTSSSGCRRSRTR